MRLGVFSSDLDEFGVFWSRVRLKFGVKLAEPVLEKELLFEDLVEFKAAETKSKFLDFGLGL